MFAALLPCRRARRTCRSLCCLKSLAQQETPPPPAAPRSVNVPKPVEKTLTNGLRVIVVERTSMPLVAAQLLVKNGGEVDPPQTWRPRRHDRRRCSRRGRRRAPRRRSPKRSRRSAARSTPARAGTPRGERSASCRRRSSRRWRSSPTWCATPPSKTRRSSACASSPSTTLTSR